MTERPDLPKVAFSSAARYGAKVHSVVCATRNYASKSNSSIIGQELHAHTSSRLNLFPSSRPVKLRLNRYFPPPHCQIHRHIQTIGSMS